MATDCRAPRAPNAHRKKATKGNNLRCNLLIKNPLLHYNFPVSAWQETTLPLHKVLGACAAKERPIEDIGAPSARHTYL